MHISSTEDSYPFDPGIFEYVDPYFHSEHYVNQVPSMYHETQDSYFVLLAEIVKDFIMIGKTNQNFSFPQRNINENQVFDRGKKSGKVGVAWGHQLV